MVQREYRRLDSDADENIPSVSYVWLQLSDETLLLECAALPSGHHLLP